jgi:hypothetical protein
MARKPLRSQLNQIRAWVRQGRTDAWIAHELAPEDEDGGDLELRDEIEAEIEQATRDEETAAEEEDEDEEPEEESESEPEGAEGEDGDAEPARRRRRRRGRRGGGARAGAAMQATFDHGTDDGFGLWLDPAVADDPVYSEHWAGHRRVEVTIEPDRIVIRRV